MRSVQSCTRIWRLLALGSVATVSSCSSGFTDVVSTLSIGLFEPADALPGLRAEVTDVVFGTRRFDLGEFEEDTTGRLRVRLEVAEHDSLTLTVQLEQDGMVIADGSLSIELYPDFNWGVAVFRQVADPFDECFGCDGSVAVDIATGYERVPGERVWLTWGGRPWSQTGII